MPKYSTVYPYETKIKAVEDYLAGGVSRAVICSRYGITHAATLSTWVHKYGGGRTVQAPRKRRPVRETTFEERVEIVEYCLAHNKDYAATMARYGVSSNQLDCWVTRYVVRGPASLEKLTGRPRKIKSVVTMPTPDVETARATTAMRFLQILERLTGREITMSDVDVFECMYRLNEELKS